MTEDLDNSSPASPPPYSEDIPTVEWSEGLSSPPPPSYTDVIQHREEYPSAILTGNIPDGYALSISPSMVINSSYNSSVDHHVNSSESTSHQPSSLTITSLQQQPLDLRDARACRQLVTDSIVSSYKAMVFFFPIGIIAYVKAHNAKKYYLAGNQSETLRESQKSLLLAKFANLVGGVIMIVLILTVIMTVTITVLNH